MSINRAILLGHVGADPEIRSTTSGDKVASFRIATSETWKDKNTGDRKESTEWHSITVFNQNIVQVVEQYVRKGARVSVEGAIKTRKWQDQAGNDRWTTEIVIGRFDGRLGLEGQPQGAKRDEHGYGETRVKDAGGAQFGSRPADMSSRSIDDDEIPF